MHPADEFVEQFVGADRALKRLALTRVRELDLRCPCRRTSATAMPRIADDVPLRDALAAAARRPARQEGIVVDGDGQRARRDLDRPDLAVAGAAGVIRSPPRPVIPDFGGGETRACARTRASAGTGCKDNWSDVLWPACASTSR